MWFQKQWNTCSDGDDHYLVYYTFIIKKKKIIAISYVILNIFTYWNCIDDFIKKKKIK